MQIIPVIDLLNGIVVHGVGGDRSLYKPIESVICRSSEPIDVVQSMLNFYPFNTIYVADLDSLQGTGCSSSIIESLSVQFPNTEFWIDGGIKSVADLKRYPESNTIKPIIASECIANISDYKTLVNHLGSKPFLLSLDHKNGELGARALFRDSGLWPNNVIVMALNSVGKGSGPDHELIARYRSRSPLSNFFCAGGVRNITDIESLLRHDTAGALIASALHNGKISEADLKNFEAKKYPA